MKGKVTATSLNVRSGAGTNSSVIGGVKRGDIVIIDKQRSKEGWHFIKFGAIEGYVSADYIEITEYDTTTFITGKVTATSLNVRSGAGTNSSVIGSVKQGDIITIDKGRSIQGWYFIKYGSNGGYVSADYVEIVNNNKEELVTGTVTATSLNIRSAAGTNSSVIGSLKQGEKVTIDKVRSTQGWYFIKYGSNGGYVSADYVDIENNNKEEFVTGKVTATSLNVRSAAGTNSSVIGSVKKGETVTIDKQRSVQGWYFIKYGSNGGYVSADYVQVGTSGGNTGGNTSTNYTVSDNLVEFIKQYEGFSATHYRDSAGVDTIGYGSTHGWIMKLSTVTKEQATRALKEELEAFAQQIKRDLNSKNVRLKQCEFDALCSFAYNLGAGALFKSTLYKRICSGVRDSSLKENFTAYCHAGGKVLQGLLNRRKEEYDMFMTGDYRRDY